MTFGMAPWRDTEKWGTPFQMIENLQDEMNKLFNFSLASSPARSTGLFEGLWSPAIDIHESKDDIVVKADLPGMNKDDIEVYVHGNTLVIKGEKKRQEEKSEEGFVRKERFYGSFHRAFTLPAEVEADSVNAKYQNGVLELKLNKKEEAKPKQIKVDVQ